jgi:hypothetical protein
MKTLVVLCCLSLGLGTVLVGVSSASAVPTEWSYTKSPHGPGEQGLFGVSCVRLTMCVAAGRASDGGTLFESWNGSAWTVTPSPTPPGHPTYLGGVSCANSRFCVAAGYDFGSSGTQTAIETWNGTDWSVTPSPNVGGDYFYGVSCANPIFCIAVGRSVVSMNENAALIESWNGREWTVVSSPDEGTTDYLYGVSCTSTTNCIADGWAGTSSGGAEGLIERWNGSSWSIMTSPNVGSVTELSAVSCASSVTCMAVGIAFESSPNLATVVESWNGSEWTIVPSPNPGNYDNILNGVSCISRKNCVAVGDYYNQSLSSPSQTMVESWNGDSLSVTSSPDHGPNSNGLNAVSCADRDDCVAVGDFVKTRPRPLIETGTSD